LVKSSRDFVLSGQLENLTLLDGATNGEGNALTNAITGNAVANTLTGGAGDDVLDGGQGADRLVGNQGNDTFMVDNAGDVVVEAAGEGYDTVVSTLANYTIADTIEALTLSGLAANGEGNAGDNVLTGNRFANVLNGGAGADTMIGGQDSDSYYVDNVGDKVVEQYLEGFDSVLASVNYTLSDYVEQLTLTGSATVAYGNSGLNVLNGNALNNTLDGLGGSDTMIGGLGDDAYWVDSLGDTTVEYAGQGFDTVASTVSYYIGDNIEKVVLFGAAVNATGNNGANILVGNALGNTLDGWGGADWMEGGLGDDAYWIDNGGDNVVEQAGQGFDTVASFVSYTLSANVEKLILLGSATYGAAGAGNNFLTGNDLANTLDGGAGADRMEGGLGDDAYWVDNAGDVVIEGIDAGFETIASFVDYTLPANVEQLVLLGTAVRGTGSATGNILVGNAVGNILDGGGGGDILDGGAGADSLTGGTGDDSYWVDNTGDMIFEFAGQGFETVASFVSYTLSANVEKLILLGSATVATGSAETNILVGNALGNTINGLGGDDWLEGGAGVDHFVFGPGAGHDRIVDFGLGGEHDALDVAAYIAASVTWSVTQQGADTLVAFANGDSVLLADFNSGQLHQSGDLLLA
jgi:serralysin